MEILKAISYKLKAGNGYIALTMILVIVAVVIALSTTVALLAIGEGQSSLAQQKGEDNWSFIDGCAEDALQKIHDNGSYTGGNIIRPEGTCTVSTAGSSPPTTWNLTISTDSTTYKRSVQIVATRGSTITITSWLEI